jgi:sentrin-specific protease 7
MLGYVEEFLKDPDTTVRKLLAKEKTDWDINAPRMRSDMRALLFRLQKEQNDNLEQEKEAKRKRKREQLQAEESPRQQALKSASIEKNGSTIQSRSRENKAIETSPVGAHKPLPVAQTPDLEAPSLELEPRADTSNIRQSATHAGGTERIPGSREAPDLTSSRPEPKTPSPPRDGNSEDDVRSASDKTVLLEDPSAVPEFVRPLSASPPDSKANPAQLVDEAMANDAEASVQIVGARPASRESRKGQSPTAGSMSELRPSLRTTETRRMKRTNPRHSGVDYTVDLTNA